MNIFFLIASLALAEPTVQVASPQQPVAASPVKKELIDLPAPIGEDMKGIVIPQFDPDGRLSMNFLAEKARKLDEKQVAIESLKIDFFEKDGKDVTVLVPRGIFNLETKILTADSEVTIKREDFDMVGQSATFDTTKRFGTMKGHVHTEIRNSGPTGINNE